MSDSSVFDLGKNAEFSDAHGAMSSDELMARTRDIASRLQDAGLADARLCLPLDSGLESLATLIAVMDNGIGAALLPRPPEGETPTAPAFCDAIVMPAPLGAKTDDITIIPLKSDFSRDLARGPGGWHGHVWMHTSGTTAAPKWVLLSVDALHRSARSSAARLRLTPEDRVMTTVPIHHSYGLGAGLMSGLVAGSSVRMVARGNPLTVFQAQRAFQPTAMFMVPSQARSILALGRKAGRARVVVVAGDRLLPEEAAAFEADHGTLVGLYGSTETNAMTASNPDDPAELRYLTAGQPLDGVELKIESQPTGTTEDDVLPMRVVASTGFSGYADPETGLLKDPAPEIWTPKDLVRLHDGPDGIPRIEVVGRTDHAVNRDGLIVHLGHIEGCLSRSEGVALAAVIPAGRSRRGVGLMAFCTLENPDATTEAAILAHCRAVLPDRAVPDSLEILQDLPLLASGKVDRGQLTKMAEQRVEERAASS